MTRSVCARACLRLAMFAGLLASPIDASAQTSNATLQGTITDNRGSVLPGVTVKLESPSTGLTRDIVTNASGV